MAINYGSYPGCCTAKILFGFGGSNTAMYGGRAQPAPHTLSNEISRCMEHAVRDGQGILTAATTTEQTVANDVLAKLGWTKAMESHKDNHSETRLILWAFACKTSEDKPVDVTNPFLKVAPPPPAPVVAREVSLPCAAPMPPLPPAGHLDVGLHPDFDRTNFRVANREYTQYRNAPRDRWIRIDGTRPMPESLRGKRIQVLTRRDLRPRNASHMYLVSAERWLWSLPEGASIVYIYIPSAQ